jgi:hypothetical protein
MTFYSKLEYYVKYHMHSTLVFLRHLFQIGILCPPSYMSLCGVTIDLFNKVDSLIVFFSMNFRPLKGLEEACFANFVLCRYASIKYPGAYSLEFQSVMQIWTECLLKWDIKRQTSKGKGILGTVLAFAGGDKEEQGRKTLH